MNARVIPFPAGRVPARSTATPGTPLDEPLARGPLAGDAKKLAKLGLGTAGDLLTHFPRRYVSLGQLTPLNELVVGEHVTFVGEVASADLVPIQRQKGATLLKVTVFDGRSDHTITFFNGRKVAFRLKPGVHAVFSCVVGEFRGRAQLTHPDFFEVASASAGRELAEAPFPLYPAGQGVKTFEIWKAVGTLLDVLGDVPDPIPEEVRTVRSLMSRAHAFQAIHRPRAEEDWRAARRRFMFEEAFVLQVALAQRRAADRLVTATPRRPVAGGLLEAFDARLPFELTGGQRRVADEIAADMAREWPMQRLLQGEVGSGKTVVALRAMLSVVDAGAQAALLAPTEVLAAQHHRSITALLGPLAEGGMLGGAANATRVALLTGSQSTAARRAALLDAVSGDAGIVVGTHALLQDRVEFHDLGLVVVDEQHRFGVEQRDTLRGKGKVAPHVLVMTATPIPRTVAMTVFGDLETSTLRELPQGRTPITTHLVSLADHPTWETRIWQRVREEVDAGHQVFVVCPRIGDAGPETEAPDAASGAAQGADDADLPLRAVVEVIEELRSRPELAGLTVQPLHGRVPVEEREATMRAFAAGDVHVLVATTVVEVGVDVPNATLMVLLDADRFGISQLHQLRGRVGRGGAPSTCLLVTQAGKESSAYERLVAVAGTLDGFELARVDLEQRREGDVLGAAQSGRRSSLRLLRVLRDEGLIEAARHEAVALVARDPEVAGSPALRQALDELLEEGKDAYLERT
ncbi:MAG TPA: ATP-dependent DNA helicase RecG [Kineosporiaceae bacterium]|nr:ATP-dependent DNA helicase RecG [Kineosporiaceae bacterium]